MSPANFKNEIFLKMEFKCVFFDTFVKLEAMFAHLGRVSEYSVGLVEYSPAACSYYSGSDRISLFELQKGTPTERASGDKWSPTKNAHISTTPSVALIGKPMSQRFDFCKKLSGVRGSFSRYSPLKVW